MLVAALTCLICSDRVTGETKAFTSQCKLRKGHDGIRNYDAYKVDFSARNLNTVCFFKGFYYLASLFYSV